MTYLTWARGHEFFNNAEGRILDKVPAIAVRPSRPTPPVVFGRFDVDNLSGHAGPSLKLVLCQVTSQSLRDTDVGAFAKIQLIAQILST